MSEQATTPATEPMRTHVEAIARRYGWTSESREGAFEFVQRMSYRTGWEDGKKEAIDPHRDTPATIAGANGDPVAWRVRRHDAPKYWIVFLHKPVDAMNDPEREVQPLYAHPPATEQALTEREVGDCIDKTNLESQYGQHQFGWSKDLALNILAALIAKQPTPDAGVVEDAQLLDWLERQHLEELSMGVVIDAPHDGEYYVNGDDGVTYYGKTLREALRAARAKEQS